MCVHFLNGCICHYVCICISHKVYPCYIFFPKKCTKSFASFQVGKGRDVGLNQIALFEGKVAGGNGEQVLSRDVYRLGQLFDFFRMLTFFFTTVGYYVCTMVSPHLSLCVHGFTLLCHCLVVPKASYMGLCMLNQLILNRCI